MRIKSLKLTQFKRFDNLTINLGADPKKVVALVGPNGSGKSSVFDAFEQMLQEHVGADNLPHSSFFSKRWFDASNPTQTYAKHESIKVETHDGKALNNTSFYVRSAYRFTPRLRVEAVTAQPDPRTDSRRPGSSINLDQRLQGNYERLLGQLIASFWEKGGETGDQVRAKLIGRLNQRLRNVLDIQISDLGNVTDGKGQLFFEKGTSKNFPFENLSAGEKEVVDLLVDLEVKVPTYSDTVFCIDEPELHLNTAIQRKLLRELAEMIPDNCQLWVATHSIGFLRALQQDLGADSQVLDFSAKEYFAGSQTIIPIRGTRADWRRIFNTALEDLTGLVAPAMIIYCEGRAEPADGGAEQGLDAQVYNAIFEDSADVLFISSGGGGAQVKNSGIALKVLSKAFEGVSLRLLKDRDELSDTERDAFLAVSSENRMLNRREIENYLFDAEVLLRYCQANSTTFDRAKYDTLVPDPMRQDLKAGQTLQQLKSVCGFAGTVQQFKLALAPFIVAETVVHADLKACVLQG